MTLCALLERYRQKKISGKRGEGLIFLLVL